MSTSFDVRVYAIRKRKDSKKRPFNVRWIVAGRAYSQSFATAPLADGFRSKLVSATKNGEPFDTVTGLPPSMDDDRKDLATAPRTSAYAAFLEYAEYKWGRVSAKYRIAVADALRDLTVLLLPDPPEWVTAKGLRTALRNWGFNFSEHVEEPSDEVLDLLGWVEETSPPVGVLSDAETLRGLLDGLTRRHDGKAASARHFTKRRTTLSGFLKFAVAKGYLPQHPLHASGFFWDPPRNLKIVAKVDPRAIGNREQVESLLTAVSYAGPNGPRFVAFFGCMYYAMMRPEEVASLALYQCELPSEGWGSLTLEKALPLVGGDWTDTGSSFEERSLKHRPDSETRVVPIPPRLVELLRAHVDRFGLRADGRLFSAPTGGLVGSSTYWFIWNRARDFAMAPIDRKGLRLKRPYNLRHSGVSLRLYAGVPPQQVADWAGHSLEMLYNVYSKVLDGFEKRWQDQMDKFMGEEPDAG
ncbi:tyrosine-type recombinase/integrase [Glycomyces paridis]|uniref:Tyr recombinase domain-containing protein n=1 Tax=Glycomyces paridis TaxID=2126555 RepID=A0A4S8PGJ2_9ACTN|nr:tyrosine-type recombinase/integrase [Glycomyces paridis]THV29637.1 hypothetical protein E9998_09135 [Glycomyces paridis]